MPHVSSSRDWKRLFVQMSVSGPISVQSTLPALMGKQNGLGDPRYIWPPLILAGGVNSKLTGGCAVLASVALAISIARRSKCQLASCNAATKVEGNKCTTRLGTFRPGTNSATVATKLTQSLVNRR